MPQVQFNFFKQTFASPTGHVDVTFINPNGARETYGLGNVQAWMYLLGPGSVANVQDEHSDLSKAQQKNMVIPSPPLYITDTQCAAVLSSILAQLGKGQIYSLTDKDTLPGNGSNCLTWLNTEFSKIIPGFKLGDQFTQQQRKEMCGPIVYLMKQFTSPDFQNDYVGDGTISGDPNPFQDPTDPTVPPGGFDRTHDPDAWRKYFDKAQDVASNSPIVLDLDGGGIQTTAVNPYGAHFDLDANGFAEAVGWVAPGEGLLVRGAYRIAQAA